MGYSLERVIYAHREGTFKTLVEIGDPVEAGQEIAEINGEPVRTQIKGAVHGLLRDGLKVKAGVKVGDIEPSGERELCFRVTDKSLKIGSSVVEVLRDIDKAV
jgi:xanthine dehydrogenase accessory factor